jgi:Domain of unknown function (DUF4276)
MKKLQTGSITFSPRNFSGKQNLLKKLPDRLKGYKTRLKYEHDLKIVVLIDEDREDCTKLKQRLEDIAKDAGLLTRSISENFQILNRIAVEELEAWFFGDVEAIRKAYPRVPASLSQNRNYRKPDEIKGGTCEALERVLSSKGYFTKGYMPKTEVARNIAPHLHPEDNVSKSFQVFKDGLKLLIEPTK